MSGFLAFLQALPKLLAIMEKLGNWITENGINSFLDTVEKTIDDIRAAKTAEEKQKAAKGVVDLVRQIVK